MSANSQSARLQIEGKNEDMIINTTRDKEKKKKLTDVQRQHASEYLAVAVVLVQ